MRKTRTALFQEGGLNQEGSVGDIQVRRRVLRGVDLPPKYFRRTDDRGNGQRAGRDRHRDGERNMRVRQKARRLWRHHVLAAVVFVVGRIAAHRPAALHRLLVCGHGLAFRELHRQEDARGYEKRCDLVKHPLGFPNEIPSLSLWLFGRAGQENGFISSVGRCERAWTIVLAGHR